MSQIQNKSYVSSETSALELQALDNLKNELSKQAVNDDEGSIPPADDNQAVFSSELPQLSKPKLSAGSSIALDILLDFIDEKTRDSEVKAGLASVKANAAVRDAKNKKNIEDIKKQIEKLEHASFWGKIGSVFKYVGMALAAVACVAMIATGVGSGVGVAGLVLLGLSVANQILDAVGQAVCGEGWSLTNGIAKLAEVLGASKEVKEYLKLGLDLAISIAATVCTLGASAGSTMNSASKIVDMTIKCATVAQGVTGVTSSGAQIASSVYTYQSEMARADQKRLQAILEQLQMVNDLINEHLKAVLEQAQKVTEGVTEIVNQNADVQTKILSSGGGAQMA